ncbi:MAG: hypothetical protein SFU56_15375 [Capsulimonadales bacterium]|nr:hypothetical protein [Capsulimonadales bacterium]
MANRKPAFGRPKASEDYEVQELLPPSRAERMQNLWMFATVGIAIVVLGLGMLLRFTVFADRFNPPKYTTVAPDSPGASSSPNASASSSPTPPPSSPSPTASPSAAPSDQVIDVPSLSRTGGRPVSAP